MSATQFDVCIIGAGVAGGTMAAYLGANGLRVAVVEKVLAEQDRIVGELLQPGGVQMLRNMGLENILEGYDAQPVTGYGIFLNGKHIHIKYPEGAAGCGLRNGKLVQKIRERMAELPNVTLFEGNVTNLYEEEGEVRGLHFLPKNSEQPQLLRAPLTIVSDGIFSAFRDKLANGQKKVSGHFLGLLLKDCKLPYEHCGHVIIAKPSPVLCYPVTSTESRVLIDFPQTEAPRKTPEMIDYLRLNIAPQLPEEIRGAFLNAVEEGKFKMMPNHFYPAKPVLRNGVVLLGDSLNMRHPLTGGGMTVAFTDCYQLGAQLIARKANFNAETAKEAVAYFYAHRHESTATINILADALYGVMSNEQLKDACYDYLQRGGVHAEEPISLLSAVSRDKNLLLRHFFAVALYGAGNTLGRRPDFTRVKRSWQMLKDAVRILSPLVLNERPNALTRFAFRTAGKVLN